MGSKVELMSGGVFLFNPWKSMKGRRVPSFLDTDKNPAPAREELGLMSPAAKDLWMSRENRAGSRKAPDTHLDHDIVRICGKQMSKKK